MRLLVSLSDLPVTANVRRLLIARCRVRELRGESHPVSEGGFIRRPHVRRLLIVLDRVRFFAQTQVAGIEVVRSCGQWRGVGMA